MKNIFKLGSVFMALALLVSTLLLTGVLASAEPDWQLVWSGSIDSMIVQAADGTATLGNAELDAAVAEELANYDATKFKVESNATFTSGDGAYACWSFFVPNGAQLWSTVVNEAPTTEITDSPDVNIVDIDETWNFGIVGEGGSGTFVATEFALYAYREPSAEPTETGAEPTETEAEPTETEAEPTATEAEPTATEAEPTATEAEPTATEAEPTATEAEPTATEAEPTATEAEPTATEAEPTATEAEPTVTEAEPTATEAEPTATEAEPTATEAEPTATEAEPTATEVEPTEPVSLVETVLVENNVGGTKALKPEKTDAWFLVVNEIKADVAANGPIDPDKGEYYQIIVTGSVDIGEADFHLGEGLDWNEYWGESGSITTESSTVVATIPVAIPAEGIGDVYLADSGEAGHVLDWTYAKVSVFRVGEPTEPVASETEPVASESEPAATETGTDIAVYGDANGDGSVNMKDVLVARKYVAGIETEIDLAASDVNFDGAVNMKDILLIRKFIADMITSFTE